MAIENFEGKNIQDTFQRVVQTDGTNRLADGTGSFFIPVSSSHAITASHALFAISASHEITTEISSSHAQTADKIGSFTAAAIGNTYDSVASTTQGQITFTELDNGTDTLTISELSSAGTPTFNIVKLTKAREGFNCLILPTLTGLNASASHLRVDTTSGATPSIRLGDNNDDIISFIDQNNTVVARISQNGAFSGPVDIADNNGVTISTAQTITGVKTIGTNTKLQFRDSGIYLNSNADGKLQIVSDDKVNIFGNNVKVFAHFTASGNTITGGNLHLSSSANGHITASGDISASGDLIANNIIGNINGGTF